MKISVLVKILRKAQKDHGDVNVMLLDSEAGNWIDASVAVKIHPYTGPHGAMDRNKKVVGVGIRPASAFVAADLVLKA